MMSSPEQKLKRFLHYGKETAVYHPGIRFNNDAYQPSELESIGALIASEKFSDAAGCIVKAFSDGYSAHPEMLVYALALCVKQKTSVQLTTAAYKALKTVCATPENLFLFIKFASKLSNNSVSGSGFRKIVKEWYLKKDPKTLAEIVSRKKRYYGWSHKDLMKLVHLKAEDPAMAAVIKYVLYDISTAKKEYGEIAGTSEVLNYIQSVEDFKHMTDEQQSARTIESLHLTLEHIPTNLLKSREIWNALIGNLPLGVLLDNLERIGYLGFLEPSSPIVQRVIDALHDERLIAESRLHPAQVFVALKKYETSSKFTAAENARKKRKMENGSGDVRKIVKVPQKPNGRVVMALHELFASTCKLFLAPTGMRYLVVISGRHIWEPQRKNCYKCPHVTPTEAAVAISLCLLHADRNVSVFGVIQTFEPLSLIPLPLTTGMTVQNGLDAINEFLQNCRVFTVTLPTPVIKWAAAKKESYDVIVYITERSYKADNNVVSALNQYRTDMNLPNTKLVTVSLTLNRSKTEPTSAISSSDPGIFEICGFDGNVPRIIEAFSRGAF